MVAQRTHHIDTGNVPFPPAPRAVETAPISDYAHAPAPDQPEASDRRLRNRLIVINAVAWVGILVAVRLIFF